MQKDYYEVLMLPPTCTATELADSFRRLALRWNPKSCKEDPQTVQYHFNEVCEAYDVLSDPVKRAYYDRYGYRKLVEQLYKDGGINAGWKYGNNSQQIFDKFFSSTEVLNQILDTKLNNQGSLFSNAFGGLNQPPSQAIPNLHVLVPCTLSELYTGKAKKIKFNKQVLGLDGCSLTLKEIEKVLEIVPGYSAGVKLRFPGEGSQAISQPASDLIFTIGQLPHPLYSRSGDNLIYKATITLADALGCVPLEIQTLDGRKLKISLDQIPNPQEVKEIEGEGMPIKGTKKKGNLYIKFDIVFPKAITEAAKKELRSLLSQ